MSTLFGVVALYSHLDEKKDQLVFSIWSRSDVLAIFILIWMYINYSTLDVGVIWNHWNVDHVEARVKLRQVDRLVIRWFD